MCQALCYIRKLFPFILMKALCGKYHYGNPHVTDRDGGFERYGRLLEVIELGSGRHEQEPYSVWGMGTPSHGPLCKPVSLLGRGS